eukprot:499966-Rhodomonas_salina.2
MADQDGAVPEPLRMGEGPDEVEVEPQHTARSTKRTGTGGWSRKGGDRNLDRGHSKRRGVTQDLAHRAQDLLEGAHWAQGDKAEMEDVTRAVCTHARTHTRTHTRTRTRTQTRTNTHTRHRRREVQTDRHTDTDRDQMCRQTQADKHTQDTEIQRTRT